MTNGSNVPVLDRAKREAAKLLPLSYFAKMPTIIVIDVTNVCNLRCPVCPVTIAMTRRRGLMKLDVFKLIIDDFKTDAEKPAIYFNFSGEPTMNPVLPDMVAYASENGHETFISTNATKLEDEMCERLIKAGLSRINLCMDGFSKEAQETYRVNSDFDEVKENIERFLKVRTRLGAKNPITVLQTLLTAYSEHQIDEMTAWARAAGFDRIRYKTFSIGSYTTEEEKSVATRFLPTRDEFKRHPTDLGRATCNTPLYQTVVFWNGDLGLCCIDYDQMVQLPNIAEVGFKKAYLSKPALEARRKGFLKQFDICKGCSYSNAENLGLKVDFKKNKGLDQNGKLVLN